MKYLNYYKENATENYITTPVSVLRYITELENKIEAAISVTQCCEKLVCERCVSTKETKI